MTISDEEFAVGQLVPSSRYRVVALIGQGGMGSVYEVEHVELGKRFVLKALLKDLAGRGDLVRRLRDEWRSLGKLEHPSIVSVTDAGATLGGVPYYVMERLQGENLGQRLRRGALSLSDTTRIGADVLEALDAAHQIGIVHRDVKPPNVFLTQTGRTKLLDFGIAKLIDREMALTGKGVAIGTPRYMSPEQAAGEEVDSRSDLYAAGLLLFEMLSGQSPFEDCSPDEVFMAHLMREPPLLSDLVPGVPEEFSRLISRLLRKSPDRRPASAGSAAQLLRSMRRSYEPPSRDTLAKPHDGVLTPALSASSPVPAGAGASPLPFRPPHSIDVPQKTESTVAERGATTPSKTAAGGGTPPTTKRVPGTPPLSDVATKPVPTEILSDGEPQEAETRTSAPTGATPPPVSHSPERVRPSQRHVARRGGPRGRGVVRLLIAAVAGAGATVGVLIFALRPDLATSGGTTADAASTGGVPAASAESVVRGEASPTTASEEPPPREPSGDADGPTATVAEGGARTTVSSESEEAQGSTPSRAESAVPSSQAEPGSATPDAVDGKKRSRRAASWLPKPRPAVTTQAPKRPGPDNSRPSPASDLEPAKPERKPASDSPAGRRLPSSGL